ncbi:MAG: DM13 domain-containing protein [Sediminibacterium sp.]|nr:DM13 domain-containing protein [Sediminibacterium sp.]MDP3127323.1 DM13 domain-containing protein [Sediminibacterium sp.]
MRLTLIILLVALIAVSCKKGSLSSTLTTNDMVDTAAVLKYSGNFTSGPYGTVTGKAEIYKKGSSYEVKLANFTTSNGPALHVYLAKEAMPVNYMDLGVLKSTNGNQLYSVTGMPVFADYKYISIHCVAYNHLFGSALLN